MKQAGRPGGQNNAFKPVWGLVAILAGLSAIMMARSIIWRDIIPWRDNYAAAESEAKNKGELRLLYFTSGFCEPCEEMKRTTWADKTVATALQKYVPVKIDFLKETELDHQYGVEAIPSMIVVDDSGRVRKAITGGIDAREFLDWLHSTGTMPSPRG